MRRWIRLPTRSATSALCLGLALQLGLAGPIARAANTPSEKEARAASRAVFLQAQRDYAAERYAEALRGYTEAHRLFPMPAFIFNMAQCQRLMEKPAESLALYRHYLAEEPQAKNRKVVEAFIVEMESAVAALPPRGPANLIPSTPREEPPPAMTALKPAAAPAAPLHRQWWFWTGVAVVAGAVATGVAVASSGGPPLPPATLGDVVLR